MYELIELNKRRSTYMVLAMGAVLCSFGLLFLFFSPQAGVIATLICLVLWILAFAVSWYWGDEIVLKAASAYKLKGFKYKRLTNVVEEVAIAAGIPKPEIYLINSNSLNAFACGKTPETAKVAITTGLLDTLNRDELQGVIAHEVAHIYNRDIMYMTFLITCVGLIVILAELSLHAFRGAFESGFFFDVSDDVRVNIGIAIGFGVLLILLIIFAPIVGQLIYLSASRKREYLADVTAVMLTRNPNGLASALAKLAGGQKPKNVNKAVAPLYIVNPLQANLNSTEENWWSTHPPLGTRIKILQDMGAGDVQIADEGMKPYFSSFQKVTGHSSDFQGLTNNFSMFAPIVPHPQIEEENDDLKAEAMETTGTVRQCYNCGKYLKVPKDAYGKKVKCKHCGFFTRIKKKPKQLLLTDDEMAKTGTMAAVGASSPAAVKTDPGEERNKNLKPGQVSSVDDALTKQCVYCGGEITLSECGSKNKVQCQSCGRKWKLRRVKSRRRT